MRKNVGSNSFLPRCAPLLVLIAAAPAVTDAQLVRGRVIEASGNQPIRAAALELLDDRQKVLLKVVADSTGAFRVRAWQAGKYAVRVSALGYQTVTSNLLEVGTGEEFELNIRLAVDAIPVEPVTVVARSRPSLTEIALRGYYDRRDAGRRIGIGRFLDRGEIKQKGSKLTDVLRQVPGLRIVRDSRGCVMIAVTTNPGGASRWTGTSANNSGCGNSPSVCPAIIYLDGMVLAPDRVSIDQLVPLDWVEAIEVYRRPSELPAEFLSSGACGVVALWTRRG